MQTVVTPIYLDWPFWAVVVSIAAVVLSQIPPIHVLLKKARLDLEIYSKVCITHRLGNPNLQSHLILSNVGGRKVRVRSIHVAISRDGKSSIELPAQNYLQNQNDTDAVLFTTFSLLPNQEWAHITNFLNFFDRNDEQLYLEIEGRMQAEFREKRTETDRTPMEESDLIELSSNVVEPATQFFEKHYFWKPGEYTMTVNVLTDNKSTNITKRCRFTVFESHTETLCAIKEHYKYGGGFWWSPNVQRSVNIEVTEA